MRRHLVFPSCPHLQPHHVVTFDRVRVFSCHNLQQPLFPSLKRRLAFDIETVLIVDRNDPLFRAPLKIALTLALLYD
jgi:hypothetical protein